MTINEALEAFLFEKELGGLAPGSVKNYRVTISLFLTAIGLDLPLEQVSYYIVTNYILELYKRPISRATTSSYVRNRAIVALMLDSGLRQCEVCGLLVNEVDWQRRLMKVTGKGAKNRMVPLGRMAIQFVDDYLGKCPFKDSQYVFVDRHGNNLSGNAIRLFVYRLERKLSFKFSSHKSRHNFATNYCIDHMQKTGQTCVYDLSILMGHESIETTKKYEHFAHEIIAAENSISHLDNVFYTGKSKLSGIT